MTTEMNNKDLVGAKFIRPILDHQIRKLENKKVAVYARVSRTGEMKHHSIEAQKENLKADIEKHPKWVFAGFYVDEGITGTKLDRPAFNRMLDDAREGKIDIILTKAVSRFGRNTKLVLKILQELKELGVTVIFENENLSTDDPNGLIRLQYLSIMAEREAKQNSDNKKWAIANRYKEGIPNSLRPYGYKLVDGQLQIIPEEAQVVKMIFDMYLSGMGLNLICKELNRRDIPTLYNKTWRQETVRRMLQSELYQGDMLLQKTYIADYLTKQKKKNCGELSQYLVENAHRAIIDRETHEKVKREFVRRRLINDRILATSTHRSKGPIIPPKTRLFSQLVRCADCGSSIIHKRCRTGDDTREMWICERHFKQGPKACSFKGIRDDLLESATREVLISENLIRKDTILTSELLKKHIRTIIAKPDQELEYHFYNGNIVTKGWQYPSRSKSWTPEMRQKARERAIALNAKRKEQDHE